MKRYVSIAIILMILASNHLNAIIVGGGGRTGCRYTNTSTGDTIEFNRRGNNGEGAWYAYIGGVAYYGDYAHSQGEYLIAAFHGSSQQYEGVGMNGLTTIRDRTTSAYATKDQYGNYTSVGMGVAKDATNESHQAAFEALNAHN